MGLNIKRNKAGLYKLKSSISDELLHDGWITEDEVKKILIEKEYQRFIDKTIEIGMEFPSGYHVNNKLQKYDKLQQRGLQFIIDNWNSEDAIENKFKEICERLKISISL